MTASTSDSFTLDMVRIGSHGGGSPPPPPVSARLSTEMNSATPLSGWNPRSVPSHVFKGTDSDRGRMNWQSETDCLLFLISFLPAPPPDPSQDPAAVAVWGGYGWGGL